MIRIGVTDTMGSEHKFQKYLTWLETGNSHVESVRLSYSLDNVRSFESCSGLLLTGGHDVHPSLYHGPGNHPKITSTDIRRDDFERKLLDNALSRNIPVLGICRGLQLTNVHFGGTLIPDLEEKGFPSHRCDTWECRHNVLVEKESGLFSITGRTEGNVNSSHHQGIENVAPSLHPVARSEDGVIEALEMKPSSGLPFFELVQYHPERMEDAENPFAKRLLERFLESVAFFIEQS